MSETLEITKKTDRQVSKQVGRIASKLAKRASKLPEEVRSRENFHESGFVAFHSGAKKDERFRLGAKKGDTMISYSGGAYPNGRRITTVTRNIGNSYMGVVANENIGNLTVGADGEEIKLTQEEVVHEAARNLSDLRGEVASRETQANK
jgi:hypothetical protein